MEMIDGILIALYILIAYYLINDDSDGGRRGRLPNTAAA